MATESPNDAPGRLELLREFVNSVTLPEGPDNLETLEGARAWCAEHGLPPLENQPELERLRGFREALRAVLFANNGEGDPSAAWQLIQPYADAAHLKVTIDPVRGPLLRPECEDCADRVISQVLVILYDSIATGAWPRMRACRRASCQWAYYDQSKNGSKAWCSMETCGNREKAQRRRSRDRTL